MVLILGSLIAYLIFDLLNNGPVTEVLGMVAR